MKNRFRKSTLPLPTLRLRVKDTPNVKDIRDTLALKGYVDSKLAGLKCLASARVKVAVARAAKSR